MSATFTPKVQSYLDRLAAIDWWNRVYDVDAIRSAYAARLTATGLTREIVIADDPESGDARGARDAWDARAAKDAKDAWDARAAWDAWDARAAWDAWDARDTRAARDAKDAWDARDARAARDARDAKDAWDARDARAARDALDAWDARAAWAAWDAWDARAARAAWDAWDARAARAALDALDALDAWDARGAIGWLSIALAHEPDWLTALCAVYAPMIDAYLAGSGAHILTPDSVVVILAPRVKLDTQRRLHAERGPAVALATTTQYWWHGVQVPAAWIETPDQVDPAEVIAAPNVEQRSAGAAILGWPRMLSVLQSRVIDDSGSDDVGQLIELTLPGLPQPGRFLKAVCPRNGVIVEGVPRVSDIDGLPIETAIAAQAWRIGDPQSDYHHPTRRT